jgi:hypothetical protein
MFNLSESETEQDVVEPSTGDGMERGGTVKAKRSVYPTLATGVKGTNGEVQSDELLPRKKREREVTAVHIGPST